jgi:hypothetical protein
LAKFFLWIGLAKLKFLLLVLGGVNNINSGLEGILIEFDDFIRVQGHSKNWYDLPP